MRLLDFWMNILWIGEIYFLEFMRRKTHKNP